MTDQQGHEAQTFSLWRQDDNGNEVLIESGLTREAAEAKAAEFESRGHKQLYSVKLEPGGA